MNAVEPSETTPENAGARRKRSTRNLILRAVSALAVLALMYWCLRWDVTHASGWAWTALTAILSLTCLREFYRLTWDCDLRPFPAIGYVMGPAWLLATEWDLSGGSAAWPGFETARPVFILAVFCVMALQLTRRSNDNALSSVSATVFGMVYCCVLPGTMLHIRHLRFASGDWSMQGAEFIVVCIFVAKVSDVGALLTGSQWGRHKLIPRLSPGKTWEGALGGLAFSILLLQFMVWTSPDMALASLGFWLQAALSFLLAASGLAGDLIESAFKRNSKRKDAGAGVPGFGGMLDLVDSLLMASPVMYFFLLACGARYAPA